MYPAERCEAAPLLLVFKTAYISKGEVESRQIRDLGLGARDWGKELKEFRVQNKPEDS